MNHPGQTPTVALTLFTCFAREHD